MRSPPIARSPTGASAPAPASCRWQGRSRSMPTSVGRARAPPFLLASDIPAPGRRAGRLRPGGLRDRPPVRLGPRWPRGAFPRRRVAALLLAARSLGRGMAARLARRTDARGAPGGLDGRGSQGRAADVARALGREDDGGTSTVRSPEVGWERALRASAGVRRGLRRSLLGTIRPVRSGHRPGSPPSSRSASSSFAAAPAAPMSTFDLASESSRPRASNAAMSRVRRAEAPRHHHGLLDSRPTHPTEQGDRDAQVHHLLLVLRRGRQGDDRATERPKRRREGARRVGRRHAR